MGPTYRSFLKMQALALCLAALPVIAHAGYTAPAIGQNEVITTKYEDTLVNLAMEKKVGYAELISANPGIDPWVPGAGTKIILPKWHIIPDVERKGLILNTGELRLYYFPPDGSAPKTFPIGIGREGLFTPKGTTTIVSRQANPVWRPTPRMRLEDPELPAEVKTGPDNPLGKYALYFGWPSYRIHGTNKPKAIGRRASSGCVRMYDDEIEWVFKNVPNGTKVTSIDQPIKMAWIDGAFYVEAEPNDLQIDEIEYQNRQVTIDIPDGIILKIREKAGENVDKIDWEKVRNVLIERTGLPTKVSIGTASASAEEPVAVVADTAPAVTPESRPTDAPASEAPQPHKAVHKKDKTKTAEPAKETPEHRHDWDQLNH